MIFLKVTCHKVPVLGLGLGMLHHEDWRLEHPPCCPTYSSTPCLPPTPPSQHYIVHCRDGSLNLRKVCIFCPRTLSRSQSHSRPRLPVDYCNKNMAVRRCWRGVLVNINTPHCVFHPFENTPHDILPSELQSLHIIISNHSCYQKCSDVDL
jgi:hypothetical protein